MYGLLGFDLSLRSDPAPDTATVTISLRALKDDVKDGMALGDDTKSEKMYK